MIVTKNWLNEWIDLNAISTEQLLKTFNAIGLEVDRHEVISVPEKVVIGYVESCEKHPDADKLNVCQVNVGSDIRQIVCGASNVRAGIYVAVATVGAELPGGLIIKEAKLRTLEQIDELNLQLEKLNFKEDYYMNLIEHNLKDSYNPINQNYHSPKTVNLFPN